MERKEDPNNNFMILNPKKKKKIPRREGKGMKNNLQRVGKVRWEGKLMLEIPNLSRHDYKEKISWKDFGN